MHYVLMSAFLISLTGLAFHRTHLLSALLCLEAMMLSIFITLVLLPNDLTPSMLMGPLVMLTLSVCEAAVGLSLMIAMARSHNTDKLKTLNLLRC
uniref:NADH-ubiquinone oxidoreductase chain 4L n=1 Tax=Synapturanus sp. MNHN-RA-2020.0087 TaxID=2877831 RepID=A0A8K1LZC4_9NEOB|nr:NADH dehydrogenase subunit 4L [Synapturanus sp. MNHN-RA-2020.0087]